MTAEQPRAQGLLPQKPRGRQGQSYPMWSGQCRSQTLFQNPDLKDPSVQLPHAGGNGHWDEARSQVCTSRAHAVGQDGASPPSPPSRASPTMGAGLPRTFPWCKVQSHSHTHDKDTLSLHAGEEARITSLSRPCRHHRPVLEPSRVWHGKLALCWARWHPPQRL